MKISISTLINKLQGLSAGIYFFPLFEILSLSRLVFFKCNYLVYFTFSLFFVLALFWVSILKGYYSILSFNYLGLSFSGLILFFFSGKRLESYFKFFFYSSFFIAVLSLADYFLRYSGGYFMYKGSYSSGRLSGTFQDPNFYSFFCCIGYIIFSYLFNASFKLKVIVFLVLFLTIFLTFSRGGILSYLMFFFYFNFIRGFEWDFKKWFFCFFVLSVFFIVFWLNHDYVFGVFDSLVSRGSSGRLEIWIIYLSEIIPNNLMGSFGYAPERGLVHTHNTFLQGLDHFGLFFIPFVVFVFVLFFKYPFLFFILPLLLTLDTLFTRSFVTVLLFCIYLNRERVL